MKNNYKKGITLIALIITIIVMLILVAVTINIAVNGGLFGYAGNAAKETKEAMESEKQLPSGSIGEKTITDYIYGDVGYIKFVDYKNTRFLIVGQENNKVTLIPLTFPEENQYLLSGKYKLVNGKKKSVELSDPAATADANFSEFQTRIKEELDSACQERYGTADGKVTATNTENYYNTIMEYYQSLGDIFDEINNPEELLIGDINLLHELNSGLQESIPDELVNGNSSVQALYLVFSVGGATGRLRNILNNQINNYEFPTSTINFSNDMMQDAGKLLKNEITVDDLDTSNAYKKNLTILLYELSKFEIYIKESIHCTGSDTHGPGSWQAEVLDWWDGYSVSTPLRIENTEGEDTFNAFTTKIAPILLVDEDLLQRTGQNTYTLNIN